jgi:hypothetical protein
MKKIATVWILFFSITAGAQSEDTSKVIYNKPKTEVLTLISGEHFDDGGYIQFKNSKGVILTVNFLPEGVVQYEDKACNYKCGSIQKQYLNKKYKVTYEIQRVYDPANLSGNGRMDATVVTKMILAK